MLIREIIIDGFGIFANTKITGLTSGVNIIYGPNEFGKTTFLNFIRRILFGFPRSSSNTNPYPALNGGAYGGKLTCDLDNGESVTIHRTVGSAGGKVTIQKGASELKDQDSLNNLLGHINGVFYENVYAISLDELQLVESLNTDEVKNRIYGAGLGLGSASLTDIKNELLGQRDKLFKARGSSQVIPKLYTDIKTLESAIKEIQKGLSTYDSLVKQRDELTDEVGSHDDEIRKFADDNTSLENQKKLYTTYVDLRNAEADLSQINESEDLPENTLEKLDTLKADLKHIQERIDENMDDFKSLKTKQENLTYNNELIGLESDVITLQQSIENYKSANQEIYNEIENKKNLYEKYQTEIKKLGEGWSQDLINQFNVTHENEKSITSFNDRFTGLTEDIKRIRNKLELHQEQIFAEVSKGFTGPDSYKYAVYLIVIVGLVGIGLGIYSSQVYLTGFSSLIFIISIIVAWNIKRNGQKNVIDPLEQKYTEDLEQKECEYGELKSEWSEFLKSINLKESLTVEAALEVINSIQNIKNYLSNLDQYDERIQSNRNKIEKVKEVHDRVVSVIDNSIISTDITTNIELVQRTFTESKENKNKKENNESRISGLGVRIKKLEEKKLLKEKEILDYILSLNATDEDDLRNKYHIYEKKAKLIEAIYDSKKIIQSTVGIEKYYDSFIQSIIITNPYTIDHDLEEVGFRIKELTEERDEKNQSIGELKNKIYELASHQDLLVKQNDLELKKQQLKDCSQEWAKFQIAMVMLNKAISKYENTRQPEVIKAAEEIFSCLTNKFYTSITKPIDKDDLLICDVLGNKKSVLEMSRGTKEQLYFAMRLGLIKEYENQAESMPIIMDDILVNFDGDRGPLAIKTLNNFALERQVIVFTCHKNVFNLYKSSGANQVTIS